MPTNTNSTFNALYDPYNQARTLMVQGCTSDAGKSVLTSGICRVLANRSIQVAPFKPQNMALNSAVTIDQGEIGRAQALQAQACNLAPHSDMNPILLKPTSDTNAQVIVQGKALQNMQAQAYHDYKAVAKNAVMQSYQRLRQQYHYIVVEGAGSPAEINLRHNDIANMGFAEAANCPVIIVADIDKGGVFAHLVGTLMLLSKSEQRRVVGFIINRFRGDIKLLQSGIDWLETRTQKPVLGVIPYLKNFFLDAEDAISTKNIIDCTHPLKIVVPVLPKISNHTDFDALRLHPEVDLQFVHPQHSIQHADMVIVPGSKNTISDLRYLQKNNWQKKLDQHLQKGGKIIGICGGLQMLGQYIEDNKGVENNGTAQRIKGFDLLPLHTQLTQEKKLTRVNGHLSSPLFGNTPIQGYEIHCGHSQLTQQNLTDIFCRINQQSEGHIHKTKPIIATYLHGVFDNKHTLQALLQWAGLSSTTLFDINSVREQQLTRLAHCLEQHMTTDFWHTIAPNS